MWERSAYRYRAVADQESELRDQGMCDEHSLRCSTMRITSEDSSPTGFERKVTG